MLQKKQNNKNDRRAVVVQMIILIFVFAGYTFSGIVLSLEYQELLKDPSNPFYYAYVQFPLYVKKVFFFWFCKNEKAREKKKKKQK